MQGEPITLRDYWQGRAIKYPPGATTVANATALLKKVNMLLVEFGEWRSVNSGYRPPIINALVGGAKGSKHQTGDAIDLEDKDGQLKLFCSEERLASYDLYMEHGDATPTWVHLQRLPPTSGVRIFKPNR